MTYGHRAKLFISRAKKWEYTEMIIVLRERRVNKGRLSMSLPCIVSTDTEILDKCTTFDLGKGGMSIFSNKSLEIGHVIELQCKDIWDNPKTGTVKWHQKIKHNLYRIGISFS
jgi:hypothetical protein